MNENMAVTSNISKKENNNYPKTINVERYEPEISNPELPNPEIYDP